MAEERKAKHAGYAGGAKTFDRKAWEGAVRRLLDEHEEVEIELPDGGKATRKVHETDPPADQTFPWRLGAPGPLPKLVREEEVAKKARVQVHEHRFGVSADLDALLYHAARVAVLEARRIRATALALREPVVSEESVVLAVVYVLP